MERKRGLQKATSRARDPRRPPRQSARQPICAAWRRARAICPSGRSPGRRLGPAGKAAAGWPSGTARPIRLLARPRRSRRWRRCRTTRRSCFRWPPTAARVPPADGRKRVAAEWWRILIRLALASRRDPRNYTASRAPEGRRFWLFPRRALSGPTDRPRLVPSTASSLEWPRLSKPSSACGGGRVGDAAAFLAMSSSSAATPPRPPP